jgi:hypothetical protein
MDADFDACPVVFMDCHCARGGWQLPGDEARPALVHNTHWRSWLTQSVVQVISALKWEREFRCDGVQGLSEFKAVIEKMNAVDPGS